MKNFIFLEDGQICDQLFESGWEAFDFPSQRWIPIGSKDCHVFHWANPFSYPVNFEQSLQDAVEYFSDDVTVVCYKGNESFGVLRKNEAKK